MDKIGIIYELKLLPCEDRCYSKQYPLPKEFSATFFHEGEDISDHLKKQRIKRWNISSYNSTVRTFLINEDEFFIRIPDFVYDSIREKTTAEQEEKYDKIIDNERERKEGYLEIIKDRNKTIDRYKNAGFWSRLKYLFTLEL